MNTLNEKKKLDKVDKDELEGDHEDREDQDIDNDGDVDDSDEYLHKRRKAVSKAIDNVKKKKDDDDDDDDDDLDESVAFKDLSPEEKKKRIESAKKGRAKRAKFAKQNKNMFFDVGKLKNESLDEANDRVPRFSVSWTPSVYQIEDVIDILTNKHGKKPNVAAIKKEFDTHVKDAMSDYWEDVMGDKTDFKKAREFVKNINFRGAKSTMD